VAIPILPTLLASPTVFIAVTPTSLPVFSLTHPPTATSQPFNLPLSPRPHLFVFPLSFQWIPTWSSSLTNHTWGPTSHLSPPSLLPPLPPPPPPLLATPISPIPMSSSRKTSSFDRPRSPILTLGLSLTSMGFLLTPSAFTVQAKNGQCTGGAQRVPREARPVCNHPIQHIWRKLGEQVYGYLDSLEVLWSTIDPVRFAEQGGKPGPLYLWVGVNPGSLSLEVAKAAATGCKEILAAAKFPDIGIAFRESILTRSAGPQFLDHIPPGTPTADIRSPFTGALGVPIAPRNSPHFEGTGALYICEGDQAERVFLLTARHVVLPPRLYSNELYEHKVTNEPPQEVLILGAGAYERATNDMKNEVANQATCVEIYTKRLARLGNPAVGENPVVTMARRRDTGVLEDAKEAGLAINNLYSRVAKDWTSPALRVLGHVVYAPPISVGTGPKEFTEDWALIELNRDKINWDNFKGNVVYLGTFQSTLQRLSSLTSMSRRQDSARRPLLQDEPSQRQPPPLQVSG